MAFEKPSGMLSTLDKYRLYRELPLSELSTLPYSVYIVDYDWRYLFINDNAKKILGSLGEELIGRSALEVFKDPLFNDVFEKLTYNLEKKLPLDVTTYSPLRTSQTRIKGYPLNDCYVFCSVPMPATADVLKELRDELNKKRKA